MRLGRAAGVTDTGRRRLRNEDAFVCEPPLFAIADGMGGARAGEIAAGIAAAALESGRATVTDEASLEAVIAEANRLVWERSVADPATAGMGTTVTAALVDAENGQVVFGQVGDSRAYRLRGDALEQITTDHSLVAELVRSGVLSPEEAERHPQRSAITRAVGTESAIEVDVFSVPGEVGDLYLLCSDGLTDMLGTDQIAATILGADREPAAAAEALVAAANARGGEDNITVVLFELVEGEEPEAEAAAAIEVAAAKTTPEASAEDDGDDTPAEATSSDLEEVAAPPPPSSRHGAGQGGRLAALLLIVGVLVVAIVALYWGIAR